MKKLLAFLSVLILGTVQLIAQPGCPAVDAGADRNIPCGQSCANLTAVPFSAGQTTQYTVNQISYNPPFQYNTGTAIIANTDDLWSSAINLPFTFCFFGNSYNQLVIGSNGILSFNTALAGTFCQWTINSGLPLVGPANYTNCIMGPYHDIDPEVISGTYIRYEIGGTAPCRYFKIAYNNVPMYQCNSQRATHMTVLYETTNAIEVYIQNKPTCSGWNSGAAIEGIVNAGGTLAYNVPGRGSNTPTWTASNDAWRFTPSGAPNYTIAWFEGSTQIGTGASIQVCPTTGTTYRAEATYSNCDGATVVVSDDVFVGISGLTVSVDSTTNPSCAGATDGAVHASFNTSSAILSYGWTPGGANQTSLTGIGAGTYIFSATDQAGCVRSDTVVLTDPAPIQVTVPDTNVNYCNGTGPTDVGSLTGSVSGAVSPFTYLWNTGDTVNTIGGLVAGTYTLTVTDANGCTGSDPGTVAYTALQPVFNLPTIQNIACNDSSTGAITVSMSLVVPPVRYQWSTSVNDTTNTVSGLSAGTYSVTGTDAFGCSATASYTLLNPPALTLRDSIIDSYCGLPTAEIHVFVEGGTPVYNYGWSTGDTTTSILGVPGDTTYYLTITDAVGCTLSDTFTVGNGAAFTISGNATNLLCNGAQSGAIDITVTGGNGPFTYAWTNGASSEDLTGLPAGYYTVTVTDNDGCRDTYGLSVTEPQPVLVTITPQIANCALASTGSLTASASGGNGGFTYQWTPTTTGATVANLSNGVYTVTATDVNGCSGSATYTVDQPTQLLAVSVTSTPSVCEGLSDGQATATATGGVPGYTYVWNTQATSSSITNIGAGTYAVTVTDSRGCTATATSIINSIPLINSSASVQLFACANPPHATVTITATGGSGSGFSYNVTGVGTNTTGIFNDVLAGNYVYLVSDGAGCQNEGNFTVTVPQDDAYSLVTDSTSCFGATFTDGGITVTPSGNFNPPYSYTLNGGASQTTGQFDNLTGGSYTVIVTNGVGCADTIQAVVGEPAPLSILASPDSIVTAPGVPNTVQVTLNNFNSATIEWLPTDGLSCSDCLNPTITANQTTTYVVTATNNELAGCSASATVVVIVNGRVEMPDAFSPNGDGVNDRFGPVTFGTLTIKSFRIYNRWGQLIHDKNEPWDGRYNGKEQPMDNYVYYISIETADEDNPGSMKLINKSNSFSLVR